MFNARENDDDSSASDAGASRQAHDAARARAAADKASRDKRAETTNETYRYGAALVREALRKARGDR